MGFSRAKLLLIPCVILTIKFLFNNFSKEARKTGRGKTVTSVSFPSPAVQSKL